MYMEDPLGSSRTELDLPTMVERSWERGGDDEGIMISGSSTVAAKCNVAEGARRGGARGEDRGASHSHFTHMFVTASNPYSRETATHITHAHHDGDGDGDEASFRRHARHFGSVVGHRCRRPAAN